MVKTWIGDWNELEVDHNLKNTSLFFHVLVQMFFFSSHAVMLLCVCVPVSSEPPLIPPLFPARLPPLPLCSEGCSAVTHGWRTLEKEKKKLPGNHMEGCNATICSLAPHLAYPLPTCLPPPPHHSCGGLLWWNTVGGTMCYPLINLTNTTWRGREGGEEDE